MTKKTKQAASNVLVLDADRRKDDKRRDEAVMLALCQMEAIFNTIAVLVRQHLGDIPGWPDFDSGWLPDVIRALAIRGDALNGAVMLSRMAPDELSTEDLERRVFRG